jgi:hypothetical protein
MVRKSKTGIYEKSLFFGALKTLKTNILVIGLIKNNNGIDIPIGPQKNK